MQSEDLTERVIRNATVTHHPREAASHVRMVWRSSQLTATRDRTTRAHESRGEVAVDVIGTGITRDEGVGLSLACDVPPPQGIPNHVPESWANVCRTSIPEFSRGVLWRRQQAALIGGSDHLPGTVLLHLLRYWILNFYDSLYSTL